MLLSLQTGMRCVDCGYSCHEKCAEGVHKNCTKYKAVADGNLTTQTLTRSGGDGGSVTSSKCHVLSLMTGLWQDHFNYINCTVTML
jgi:myotubularin-related protein 5/13